MGASGISSSFLGLSRTSGQVSHVLLTRSPLGRPQCCHWLDPARLACIRHAASVRPEPGSNSPSRSLRRPPRWSTFDRGEPVSEGLTSSTDWHQNRQVVRCSAFELIGRSRPAEAGANARTRFFVLYSVFKEHRSPEAAAVCGRGDHRWSVRCCHRSVRRSCRAAGWGELSTYTHHGAVSNTGFGTGAGVEVMPPRGRRSNLPAPPRTANPRRASFVTSRQHAAHTSDRTSIW
jgi:hypothetical protein